VLIAKRGLVAAAVLVLFVLAVPREGLAQAVAVAALHVGARVAPACSIVVESSDVNAGNSPSVRVVCARSALRTLRASADSGSGEDATPLLSFAGRQRLSGGEVIVMVPNLLATLASRGLVSSLPPTTDPAPVVVTLHF